MARLRFALLVTVGLVAGAFLASACTDSGASENRPLSGIKSGDTQPAGSVSSMDDAESLQLATLGGGCFWCLDAVYREIIGVEEVVSGFSGGSTKNPSYRQVMTGRTGHAEVVHLRFDSEATTYRELLEIFFSIHDPTTLNRQGPDVGPQYRSIILYHTEEQKTAAEAIIAEMATGEVFPDPIVTEVVPFNAFYPAEEYHQNYYQKNPEQAYCRAIIAPKLEQFRRTYREKLKPPQRH